MGAEVQKLAFGHAMFEIPIRHPSGKVKWDIGYTCLEFRRAV